MPSVLNPVKPEEIDTSVKLLANLTTAFIQRAQDITAEYAADRGVGSLGGFAASLPLRDNGAQVTAAQVKDWDDAVAAVNAGLAALNLTANIAAIRKAR
jgi:hypothetical protein